MRVPDTEQAFRDQPELYKLLVRTRGLEWACSWIVLFWGISLLAPGDTFARGIYAQFLLIAPEAVWGVVSSMYATLRLGALAVNGRMPQGTPILRLLGAAVGAGFFALLTMLFWNEAGIQSTGVPVYAVLCVSEFRSTIRAAADVVHAYRAQRRPVHV